MKKRTIEQIDREMIRKLRLDRGLTLEEAAKRACLSSKAHWNRIELGRSQPTITVLARMAYSLGVMIQDILTRESRNRCRQWRHAKRTRRTPPA